jgi:Protein of unknown function (DUF2793)
MSSTENLGLPYLLASQAQKHVTHNEALAVLDAVVQLGVASRTHSAPPATPEAGERYIVPDAAGGAFAGQDGKLAAWQGGMWTFHAPRGGWLAHVADEQILVVFDGTAWVAASGGMLPERLGLNTTATAPNRLAVSGEASLFTHEGAGHRMAINKAASANTASLLFQTGWSAHAEIGLAGNDDFRLKVSANGTAFNDAMVVERATGRANFPAGISGVREQLTANRTYYVAPGGSNANSGLSAVSPFATLQKAVEEARKLDCSIYNVTIQLADGSYAGATIAGPLFGGGTLFITGNNAAPANVVLTSQTTAGGGAVVSISGVKFVPAVDYIHAVAVQGSARLLVGKVDFGQAGANGDHVYASGLGEILFEQDYTITGGARRHIGIGGPAFANGINRTITLTGTPAFGGEFIYVANGGIVAHWNLTISGAATGKRYSATTTGVINLYGKAADFLPGTIAGTVASGGVYA